jgi:hypothetical protein
MSLFGLTGCLTFAGGELEDVAVPKPAATPYVQYTVDPSFSFHLDGGKMITSNRAGRDANEAILARWRDEHRIRDFGYVERANQASPTADYLVTLSGAQEGDSSVVMQLFSGLTLFALPYYVDTRYDVVYRVRDNRTGRTYRGAVNASYMTWVSLFLLPASPWAMHGRTTAFERIADHLYLELYQEGAFRPAVERRPLATGTPHPPASYPPVPAAPRPLR